MRVGGVVKLTLYMFKHSLLKLYNFKLVHNCSNIGLRASKFKIRNKFKFQFAQTAGSYMKIELDMFYLNGYTSGFKSYDHLV